MYINVTGLKKPGSTESFNEEVLIDESEEIYHLIKILRDRGTLIPQHCVSINHSGFPKFQQWTTG